ncbi:fatty acid desaturase [Maritimibacter sp. DP1N21-5]|uniref:fatty acid desaturase n=1 Tax=Maritimibacter sp. DP1N21-5 TaxID=2836867 RepID=UPI001C47C26A|nr:fatty acid desaturase [Maritimibacter sp. DP1N21-5]MBV7409484.1 fatty acid desaturase [Maritimibacter sp. DP1N21-5]
MSVRSASRAYNEKDNLLALVSLFGNFAVYFLALYLAVQAAYAGWWLAYAPLVVVLAVAAGRLYVLEHDFGHLSFFKKKEHNILAGHAVSPFTLAEFYTMQYNHDEHHRQIGNLEHREAGEIFTMTLAEWEAAGFWKRLHYRLYRNPFVLIPLGAIWTYFFVWRFPKNTLKVAPWSVLFHNIALIAWWALVWYLAGPIGVVTLALSIFVAGMLGVFLVYLQHNFEDTYWDKRPDLSFDQAALQGASCLSFGWWFDEAVANITKHDIHHLNASIPCYKLRQAHRDLEDEFPLRLIGFREALHAFTLKLWDEETGQLVPFPPRRTPALTGVAPAE